MSICFTCGDEFAQKRKDRATKCCSRKCGAAMRWGVKSPAYASEGTGYIPLQDKQWALVSEEDFERCRAMSWCTNGKGVVIGKVGETFVRMSRFVMGPDPTDEARIVDHASGDQLDNRRSNLRFATSQENAFNRRKPVTGLASRFKGVIPTPGGKRNAAIRIDRTIAHIGVFESEEDAARAYDAAARKEYGAFACVNFPTESERPARQVA